ncbi:XrtA-associated tyrosine autokinase [Methylotuvimicrobium sp.]|uniref:XrtA-associated tyrosine autokinase n=1 Tax=Methylotuvimicrobium sp. TaxID=2822413 RepID=UPI003D652EAA
MSIEKALEKASLAESLGSAKRSNSIVDNQTESTHPNDAFDAFFLTDDNNGNANAHSSNVGEKNIERFNWEFLHEHGFIDPSVGHMKIAEEFRSIKRPIMSNALGGIEKGIERSNLILVTSSVPGEGKTFSAINLAISIAAERDKQVLLIDADVAKPSVSRVLGIKRTPGLIEYLEGSKIDFSDIILQTEIAGLRIVPAGKAHQFSTELLASNKMINLSRELSERYADRIVIFDSPPLLAATQAEVLSSMVGQVILVIEAEKTAQNIVMEAVKKLESCDVVLALLNKTQRSMDMNYYGYGQY